MRTETCLVPIVYDRVTPVTARALLAGALLLSSPVGSEAQDVCSNLEGWLSETDLIARMHAPMYWFGPNELYFPTLPFHTAFDGIDNEGMGTPGAMDFADPGEVAPLGPNGRPSWDLLNADYVGGNDGPFERLGRAAIIYRVQTLSVRQIDDFYLLFGDAHTAAYAPAQFINRFVNHLWSPSLFLGLSTGTWVCQARGEPWVGTH